MPPDLDAAFRKFIPPFGAAGNPVDITGGEPPKTYQNTVKLGLSDPRIHSLILGYWHTIVTPPMVFAKLVAEVVEEFKAKGGANRYWPPGDDLRRSMAEEPVQFFLDLFRNDRPVTPVVMNKVTIERK